ncbi:uncharacterized protein [Dermacentor albipictus]|uniref:uncharacterized protein isoform X2 n=1 Tax=Dermacentor albipictus TaxID=60249 RepID=UPI0038FCBEAB
MTGDRTQDHRVTRSMHYQLGYSGGHQYFPISHACWCYGPRGKEAILQFSSAHSKLGLVYVGSWYPPGMTDLLLGLQSVLGVTKGPCCFRPRKSRSCNFSAFIHNI